MVKYIFQIHYSEQDEAFGNDIVEITAPENVSLWAIESNINYEIEDVCEDADNNNAAMSRSDRVNFALTETCQKLRCTWRYVRCAFTVFVD